MLTRFAAVWSRREILWTLVQRDLRVRYSRSILGYVWTVLDPLLMASVYFVVFTYVFNAKRVADTPYFLYLLSGLLAWQWFTGSVTDTTKSLIQEARLVRSTNLPREVWVIRCVVAKGVEYLLSLPILVGFVIYYLAIGQVQPRLGAAPVPPRAAPAVRPARGHGADPRADHRARHRHAARRAHRAALPVLPLARPLRRPLGARRPAGRPPAQPAQRDPVALPRRAVRARGQLGRRRGQRRHCRCCSSSSGSGCSPASSAPSSRRSEHEPGRPDHATSPTPSSAPATSASSSTSRAAARCRCATCSSTAGRAPARTPSGP